MKYIIKVCRMFFVCMWLANCTQGSITCNYCDKFSCLINGKQFLPDGSFQSTVLSSQTYDNKKRFVVYANNENEYVSISIKMNDVIKPGTYELADSTGNSGSYLDKKLNEIYQTGSSFRGTVTLTKMEYTNTPLAEGTFRFEATSKRGYGKVTITEGKFSVYFQNN